MIVGRESECQRLRELLALAKAGRASALILRGEPGIGKTSLVNYAIEEARDLRVVSIEGDEAESTLPFAGLYDLLRPLLGALPQLPAVQAEALRSVLAVGPGRGADRFAVAAGTLTLLGAVADERPLLVTVDDAQWLDSSAADSLVFAARRMRAERVALLFAVWDLGDQVPDRFDPLPEMRLGGLSAEASAHVLSERGITLESSAVEELVGLTGGNPLALLELGEERLELGEESRIRHRHGRPDEPMRLSERLERAFHARLEGLSTRTRQALLLLAAGGADLPSVIAALRRAGLDLTDLEAAEETGLIVMSAEQARFAHPLMRSAVYQLAPPALRRAAHRSLSEAAVDVGGVWATERRAWHLARTSPGPDDAVATELAAMADEAAGRGNSTAACSIFRESARLTANREERAQRFLQAAHYSMAAGWPDAAGPMLESALEATEIPRTRTEIIHLRCRIDTWRIALGPARDMLLAEAAGISGSDPQRASAMLLHAALTSLTLGEVAIATAAAQQAVELVPALPAPAALPASLVRALTHVVAGETKEGRQLLRRCQPVVGAWELVGQQDAEWATTQLGLVASLCWLGLDEFAKAQAILEAAVDEARAASAVGLLPFRLHWLARVQLLTGNWNSAYSSAAEAVTLAEQSGWGTVLSDTVATLAMVEAASAREGSCREHVRRAVGLAQESGNPMVATRAATALGLLELGAGHPERAVEALENVGAVAQHRGLGDSALMPWAADLTEAYIRAGRRDDAERVLAVLLTEAERTGRPTEWAAAARCRSMIMDDPEPLLHEALAWHARSPVPFERARTQLCLGEALSRDKGRHRDAARWLRAALTTFEWVGAVSWSDLTRRQLRNVGAIAEEGSQPAVRGLTDQELQVALVVARGARNVDAAQQLFLSIKTIEYHLSNIYRKLGIRSRAQLALVFSAGPPQSPR